MTTNETTAMLFIAYVALIALAFVLCYLCIKCALLQKENGIYRRFFEQQYRLESDCMDACRAMVWESVDTTGTEQSDTRRPARRRVSSRGA